jgi:predicted esterase
MCDGNSSSAPVLLQFHGAGVEADNDMVAHALDPVPDLCAWVVYPTGVTPWSGDDWHNWGFADVEAAVAAIPFWIQAARWPGIGVDTESWFVSGHSNGGQGTWYALTHHPDKVFAAAPVSGYLSIHTYVPYQLWRPMDPRRRAIIEASANSYRHELLASNAKYIPMLQQHGSVDDNVPAYHSRLMSQLLWETGWPSNYSELAGKGHWFDTVMTTDALQKFYKDHLTRPILPAKGFTEFELIVANPSDMGSKGGVSVLYLKDPGRLGKLHVSTDQNFVPYSFKTENILAFEIKYTQTQIRSVIIDGQEMKIKELSAHNQNRTLQFQKKADGVWTTNVSHATPLA